MNPAVYILLFLPILPLYICLMKKSSKRVPPGSFAFPIIGQTLSLLCAMRRNRKYGPVSKMNVFGMPTVFLQGQAANKFIYTCNGGMLANQQPPSVRRIMGERNILELSGHEHKRIRGALFSFRKSDELKEYVGRMDEEIRSQIRIHWHGKQKISSTDREEMGSKSTSTESWTGLYQTSRDIAKSKAPGELLTWDDLMRMKHTWRVAMETLRMTPPVFSSFRKVLKDFGHEGFLIWKRWQVMWAACMAHMDDNIFSKASMFDLMRFKKQASVPPYGSWNLEDSKFVLEMNLLRLKL